jgi:hypothetical protein
LALKSIEKRLTPIFKLAALFALLTDNYKTSLLLMLLLPLLLSPIKNKNKNDEDRRFCNSRYFEAVLVLECSLTLLYNY